MFDINNTSYRRAVSFVPRRLMELLEDWAHFWGQARLHWGLSRLIRRHVDSLGSWWRSPRISPQGKRVLRDSSSTPLEALYLSPAFRSSNFILSSIFPQIFVPSDLVEKHVLSSSNGKLAAKHSPFQRAIVRILEPAHRPLAGDRPTEWRLHRDNGG